MCKVISFYWLFASCILLAQNDTAVLIALDDSKISYDSEGELIFSYMDSIQASYFISFDHNDEMKYKWIFLFYDLWTCIYILPVSENATYLDYRFMYPKQFKEFKNEQYFELKNRSNMEVYDSTNFQALPKFVYKALEKKVDLKSIKKITWTESFPVKWVRLKKVDNRTKNGRNNCEFSYIISDDNKIITKDISRVLFSCY